MINIDVHNFSLKYLFFFFLFSVSGCSIVAANVLENVPGIVPANISNNAQIEKAGGIVNLESADSKNRGYQKPYPPVPEWLQNTPDDDHEYHYLVGLSDEFSSEKAARKDALSDARINYAYYTGITVNEVHKVVSSLYSSSANIFDPNFASISKHNESVNANIHRVEAKHWYRERRVIRKGSINTFSYKYWVLVQVPKDEYKRVQEWKKKEEAKKIDTQYKLEKKKERIIIESVESAIILHKKNIKQVNKLISAVKPLKALFLLNKDWDALYTLSSSIESTEEKKAKKVMKFRDKLTSAHRESLVKIANIRDSICLKSEVLRESSTEKYSFLAVTASMKSDMDKQNSHGRKVSRSCGKGSPIIDFPIKLVGEDRNTLFQENTNSAGVAKFLIENEVDYLSAEIDMSSFSSRRITNKIAHLLSKVSVEVVLATHEKIQSEISRNSYNVNSNEIVVSLYPAHNHKQYSIDKDQFFEGEIISYDVNLSREAFILMIYEDAAGNLIQFSTDSSSEKVFDSIFTRSGRQFQIPPAMSSHQFTVSAPYGNETIYVYSSERPFPHMVGEMAENGLYYLDRHSLENSLKRFKNDIKAENLAYGVKKKIIKTMPRMYSMN